MVSDAISVVLLSLVVLFTINLFYKLLVNQSQARQIRENINNMNKQVREEQKKGDKEKANQIMSELMKEQSRMMKMSLKPLLISFIIIIGFFNLVGSTYADTAAELDGNRGTVTINDQEFQVRKIGSTIRIDNSECEVPCTKVIGDSAWRISTEGDEVKFTRIVASLPVSLPFAGKTVGFIGWYIIVSIPIMIVIRKAMKIYS